MAWQEATEGMQGFFSGGNPWAQLAMGLGRSRINKRQRALDKMRMQTAYNRSIRAREQFVESGEKSRQALQQNLAARGLGTAEGGGAGGSSIAEQDTGGFERQYQRGLSTALENEEMARRSLSIYRKQRAFQRRMGPLMFLDSMQQQLAQILAQALGGMKLPEGPDVGYDNQAGSQSSSTQFGWQEYQMSPGDMARYGAW